MRISEFLSEHPCEAPTYTIEQREIDSKLRTLAIPTGDLHTLLTDFQDELRRACNLGKGLSPIRNALAHKSSLHFFQTDLVDAFPSIKPERLAGVLVQAAPTLGTYEEVVAFLKRYCFTAYAQGLPQGSPASPVLFELYCRWYVDRPVRVLLQDLRKRKFPYVVYTRYVDDITVSSREPLSTYVCTQIKKILRGAGFTVHSNKTHYRRQRKDNTVVVTGVRILDGGKVDLTREFVDSFRQELALVQQDPERDTARLGGFYNYYVEMLNSTTVKSQRQGRKADATFGLLSEAELTLSSRHCKKKKASRPHVFPKAWLDTLRSRVPLVEYLIAVAPGAKWYSIGDQIFRTRCPFKKGCRIRHYRKNLCISVDTPHRFDCPCTRGDVIAAVQAHEKVSFTQACVLLAHRANLKLPDEYYRRAEGMQLDLPLPDHPS